MSYNLPYEACEHDGNHPWDERTLMTQEECVFKKCCKKYKKKGRHCKKCPKL